MDLAIDNSSLKTMNTTVIKKTVFSIFRLLLTQLITDFNVVTFDPFKIRCREKIRIYFLIVSAKNKFIPVCW